MTKSRKIIKQFISFLVYVPLINVICRNEKSAVNDNSLGIVFFGNLGDFIVFLNAAMRIKESFSKVTLICPKNGGYEKLAQKLTCFDHIISVETSYKFRITNIMKFSQLEFDTVLLGLPSRNIVPDIYALSICANKRIATQTKLDVTSYYLKEKADSAFDLLIDVDIDCIHEIDRYAKLLWGMGFTEYKPKMSYLPVLSSERIVQNNTFAILPGSQSTSAKRWPVERFAWVAKRLHDETGYNCILLGTESEASIGGLFLKNLGNPDWVDNRIGHTDIIKFIEIIRNTSLVIANDSGGSHMAVACGTSCVVIAGLWEIGRFYPSPYLASNVSCVIADKRSCEYFGCGETQPSCVKEGSVQCVLAVSKESVLKSAMGLLEDSNRTINNR